MVFISQNHTQLEAKA